MNHRVLSEMSYFDRPTVVVRHFFAYARMLAVAFGFPSVAVRPAENTHKGDGYDTRRFSPRQGRCVEKFRWQNVPFALSAKGAKAGCAFFWLLLFAQAKKSNVSQQTHANYI